MDITQQWWFIIWAHLSIMIYPLAIIYLIIDHDEYPYYNTKKKVLIFLLTHLLWPIMYPIRGLIEFYKWWSKLEDE